MTDANNKHPNEQVSTLIMFILRMEVEKSMYVYTKFLKLGIYSYLSGENGLVDEPI